jgi:hypothetical protein
VLPLSAIRFIITFLLSSLAILASHTRSSNNRILSYGAVHLLVNHETIVMGFL